MPEATNPVDTLSAMFYDMKKAENFLLQVKELPMYAEIFKEGEKGSIDEMLKQIAFRTDFINHLQKTL